MSKGVTREDVVAVYKVYFTYYKIKQQGPGYETLFMTSKAADKRFAETHRWDILSLPLWIDRIATISGDIPGVGVILDCMEQLGMLRPSEPGDELKIVFEEGPES